MMPETIWKDASNTGEALVILVIALVFVCIGFGSILVSSLEHNVLHMFYLFSAVTAAVILLLLAGIGIAIKNPSLVEINSAGIVLPKGFEKNFIAKERILSVKIGRYGDIVRSGRLSVLPKPLAYSLLPPNLPHRMNIIEIKTEKGAFRRKVIDANGLAENLKRIGIEIKQKEDILVWEKT